MAVSTAGECLEDITAATAENKPFRLLICDKRLPDKDGFTMIEQVKRSSGPSPGIIMTLTGGVARCRERRILTHLIKPFKDSELLAAVDSLMSESNSKCVYFAP